MVRTFGYTGSFTLAPPETGADGDGHWFLFAQGKLLLHQAADTWLLPTGVTPPAAVDTIEFLHCIGIYEERHCFAGICDEIPPGLAALGLREAHGHLGEDLWLLAGRASQLLHWRQQQNHCSRCGHLLQDLPGESARFCPACGLQTRPRLSPAVIMSVVRDDAILLGRAPGYPTGMYSTLAGYVEPGETLEDAVRREVREETSIEVTAIRYVASQPWPFPDSLMVGFTATYGSGTIQIDPNELEDARWFTADAMPLLPATISISRYLIEQFLAQTRHR